ncbi:MAG: hypothetical protein QOC92_3222, partial [Acidimicrobiaceae bacterium]
LGAPLSVSVNLSGRQLLAPDLQDCVDGVLSSSGLDPRLLCMEITETVLLDDAPGATRALKRLKELGVSIAVDDFGTGYSSLTYLKRFPIDVLKIDRSFVAGLGHDREDRAIVMSVVDLAHAFGIVTVAEGVETVEQLDVLKRLGCEQAQGFHWTRALPSDAALGWMLDLARSTELAPERARGRTVLVVEDDASVRQLVRFALEDAPLIEVCEARDGREGVVMAGQFQPDVVLLDLAMPEMGGLEALPLIRAVAPRSRVIVLSGLDAEDLPARATYEGAAAYWRKDMDLSRLAERLEPFLVAS